MIHFFIERNNTEERDKIFDASKIADFELAKISKLCKYFRLSIVKIVFMIVNKDNRVKFF